VRFIGFRNKKRKWLLACGIFLLLSFIVVWGSGSLLMRPVQRQLGPPPADLHAEIVSFPSASGSQLKGWYIPGTNQKGAVVLLHGVRGTKAEMLERARLFAKEGYSVLLFDFQAHGESIGKHITFGWLESMDAQAAVKFLKEKCPGQKIGIVGVSLGGAAAVLAEPQLEADAYVLELVYANIEDAISNRMKIVLGPVGGIFTPLLSWQIRPRLGISTERLKPERTVHGIRQPKLFLAGKNDRHSTIEQPRRLFDAAAEPKELVVFDNASHQDLYAIDPELYRKNVLPFLDKTLRK
jgi:alpha-beta hydrolase superfamily lysophospholipase